MVVYEGPRFNKGRVPLLGLQPPEDDGKRCVQWNAELRTDLVAAAMKSGIWLLRRDAKDWSAENIERTSSGFEHAAWGADLDGNGVVGSADVTILLNAWGACGQ